MIGLWIDSKRRVACCVLLTLAGCASTADDGGDGVADTGGGTTGGSGPGTTQGVEESDTGSSTAQAEETIGEADTTAGDTTGASEGPCGCFEADPKRSDFEVTCDLPQSCGNLGTPDHGTDETDGPEIDEVSNLEVLECFFAAVAAQQETTMRIVSGDPSEQYHYDETLVVLEGGATLNWLHSVEDLQESYSPVIHRADPVDVSLCPDAGDSLAQWECIQTALASARGSEQCTEEVIIDIGT